VIVLLTAIQVAFASLAVVGKITLQAVPWPSLVLLRTLGATAVFVGFKLARGETWLPPPGERLAMLRLGLLGVFANQALFLAGLQRTTAVNAALLMATIPLCTVLFAVVTGREPFRPRFAAGLGVALAGLALVLKPERASLGGGHLLGDAMVVGNCAVYGVYLALARDAVVRHGGTAVVRWAFQSALPFALAIGLWPTVQSAPTWSRPVTAAVGYILLVPTAFTYAANALALGRVPASVVSVFIYLQPVVAIVMAALWAGDLSRLLGVSWAAEPITARTLAGGALVLAGVAIATLGKKVRSPNDRG
jgi:drug/metabolite transporter (DMT)-like permease